MSETIDLVAGDSLDVVVPITDLNGDPVDPSSAEIVAALGAAGSTTWSGSSAGGEVVVSDAGAGEVTVIIPASATDAVSEGTLMALHGRLEWPSGAVNTFLLCLVKVTRGVL